MFGGSSTQSGGGLFGTTNNNTNPSTGGGLFGATNTNTQTAAGGGLFGSNNNNKPATGMFGNTNTTGGAFGSSTPQNQSGGGLFGSSNTAATTGGGLFGSTNNTASGGGGLFGSSNTNTNTGAGGGLFGASNTNNNTGGGGLFGSTNTTAANTGGGGLFGSSNTANTGGGGLFGSTNNNTGGGLFGASNNNASGGGGLFGSSNNNNATGGGLFGGNNNNGAGGLFGTNNNNNQQNMQQQPNANVGPWWLRELQSIEAAYQPGQGSKFHSFFYEVVGVAPDLLCVTGALAPSHVDFVKTQRKKEMLAQIPWIDQREWQQAEERNPDPVNWMPVPIGGVDALHNRVSAQASNVREQLELLQQKPDNQASESKAQDGAGVWLQNADTGESFNAMIDQCKHEHIRLIQRLIKVKGRLERLQCIHARGGRMRSEIEFSNRLQVIQKLLEDPRGCKAQLSQLSAQMQMQEPGRLLTNGPASDNNNQAIGTGEEDEKSIFNFLDFQRQGLEHLMSIVKRDTRDLEIMRKKIALHSSNK